MHHVIKGSIMIRVEDCQGFIIKGNTIDNVDILSEGPLPDELCVDYHKGASSSDGSDRMLADLRGISVAAVSAYDDDLRDGNDASMISSNTITDLKSEAAKLVAGVDVQGVSTGVDLENNYVNIDRTAFDSPDDKWIGLRLRESASGIAVKQNNNFVQGVVIESESQASFFLTTTPDLQEIRSGQIMDVLLGIRRILKYRMQTILIGYKQCLLILYLMI